MANYKVSAEELTSVADAIRTKGGTSDVLSFPNGFVEAIDDIPTSGGSTLINKTVTENGIYNASEDNADGYSKVTVNVASKLVSGTFTGETEGSGMEITIPYSGNGYPVAVSIYPTAGANKSDETITSLVRLNAILTFSAIKNEALIAPNYNDNSLTKNKASVCVIHKNSTQDASSTGSNRDAESILYTTYPVNNGVGAVVRFANAKTMKVYIMAQNDSGYGFVGGVEYTYNIVYSA